MSIVKHPTGKILVVDDNPTNIQVLFGVLNEIGYQVAIAKSGKAALQRIHIFHPDIILLDVMMPGLDGFETCQRIKADPVTCEIPIIFMTALSDTVDKVKGLSLGAVDYITKPIQHEEVLARVQIHLRLSQTQKSLEQRTAELSQTVEQLQQAQYQLVQNEKLSALGQLAAGLAHELNNPINFIAANLKPAQTYIQDLVTLLDCYGKHYPEPHAEIEELLEELEIDYVKEDLSKLMGSMKLGSDRIYDLALSLRNFARLDDAVTTIDIHEGLESTLLILQHRLKMSLHCSAIEIVRDYGQLHPVECYPSQLNQVFMNLLSNAIDALEENSTTNSNPTITIRTFMSAPNWVTIAIADNGAGIPEAIRLKLFESFFTTKSIGKGTGLGLSISHQIITEKHHGKIDCYSTPGKGAEFVVQIPVRREIIA
ncbi:sensor histidine kinase [Leptolyngbya sp. AN03gr2]|uniref:sensor histidine kinase n=1 Tax=unclassified Leptolyngbya TaxID=2650499 RepID=UPI003D315D20